ncbi:DUF2933 domain-containing protein [Metabacillus malikii]|uniref:DUF2933 domain-containing protein n=1 Tax=Metabacillus malikii TaxID=1504265 RepID=A0ABT9ZJE6_9BACI|nr:DUF2933 domain-containing protein [Metabacillus malikii]MDQ0232404.1 hypothetical protein [Metabacillus malikii]
MEWLQLLILLICPLMMIFCMKGMFGHKNHDHHSNSSNNLNDKMLNLELENKKLREEIEALSAMVKKES